MSKVDVMRRQYRPLDPEEASRLDTVKAKAEDLYRYIESLGQSRELALARTKVEEAVMWAAKDITA